MKSTVLAQNIDLEGVKKKNVYSNTRNIKIPDYKPPKNLQLNTRIKMDGMKFLKSLQQEITPIVFFDPQYRGVLDKLKYGNEGKTRGQKRSVLPQMTEATIISYIKQIEKVLIPSGHLFLWIDKFHLCQDFHVWLSEANLEIVDLITWDKERLGMGYRTRRVAEYLVIIQKTPKKAKGVWKLHNIRDVWSEKKENGHTHSKPIQLQSSLIEAVSNEGDCIIDPTAGSFSVMKAANMVNRNFLGCDING